MPAKSDELSTAGRELTASRTFKAPKDLVFKLWTQPEHLANWWGPTGFTTTTHEIDVRPGGTWRFVMHGPDGTDYDNEIVFVEITPNDKLVYDHVSAPHHITTVTFDEDGQGTRVDVHMLFDSVAERKTIVEEFGVGEGLKQHLASLDEEVQQVQRPTLTIVRTFNAPRELVFKMWTDPELFKRWWGPHTYTTPVAEIDARKGGTWFVCMRSPDGEDTWFKGTFTEIVPPERIVIHNCFTDADGNRISPEAVGLGPDFPDDLTMTVTFTEAGGQTRMTLEQSIPQRLVDTLGARIGWLQSFEKFAEALKE